MIAIKLSFISVIYLLSIGLSHGQDKEGFVVVKKAGTTTIYERWITFPNSDPPIEAREVKGEFFFRNTMFAGFNLLQDEEKIQQWQSHVSEFKVYLERDTMNWMEYSYHDIPWPVIDAIKSNEVAVKANELALEGVRAENSVGTRTILDVLNAEQELLNSQVAAGDRAARRLCRRLPAAQCRWARPRPTISGSTAGRSTTRSAIIAASPATGTTGRAIPRARPGRDQHRHPGRTAPQGVTPAAAIGNRDAMAGAREPSMEDILASIKRVIAEEKEIRAAAPPAVARPTADEEDDVLELDESMEALSAVRRSTSARRCSRMRRPTRAARSSRSWPASPPPRRRRRPINPLEEMVREMLRPILKQWLDEHLPGIVDEHVKREIHRITGRPV